MRTELLNDLYVRDEKKTRRLLDEIREATLGAGYELTLSILRPGAYDAADGPVPYSERLAGAVRGIPGYGSGQFSVNTYPFGRPTKEIFPEFVGVCSGKERSEAVLTKARQHCKKMEGCFPADQQKSVIILTDKWNDAVFREKYEREFLRYSLQQNVLFVFLLVTDHGVARIPFLAENWYELGELQKRDYRIETFDARERIRWSVEESPICRYHFNGGTWRQYEDQEFIFDLKRCVCCIRSGHPLAPDVELRQIPESAARDFAEEVRPLCDSGDIPEPVQALDAGTYEASVFGYTFCWSVADEARFYKRLSAAFQRLIGALR